MRRRKLLLTTAAICALVSTRTGAQAKSPRIVGWLAAYSKDGQTETLGYFVAQMARLGHYEGRDIVIEGRWTDARAELLPVYARELVSLRPAVIVTGGIAAISALKAVTSTVPIVFASSGDPVAAGFVKSLARPGGNITGVTLRAEVLGKLFDLARDVLPAARRVALLEHGSDPAYKRMAASIRKAAEASRFELVEVPLARIEDADRTVVDLRKAKVDAVIAPPMALFLRHAGEIGALGAKARLPVFGTWRTFADNGGLLSYYSDQREAIARTAVLTDKILRGASPADLAVEQPDRYALVVNLKSAKALGIAVPQSVLVRADEVIQ